MSGRVCAVPGCDSAHSAKGFCHKHYMRWRTHGDPLVFKGTEIGAVRDYFESVVLTYEGNDCLIWPYARVGGYGSIKRGGKDRSVHRLACEEQNGPPPTPKHDAAHSCGKGHLGCVTKKHLSWKTRAENMADTVLHGTHNKGEKHPKAKITEAQAREILSMKGIELQRDIAKRLGTTRHTVAEIHAGRNWRHLSIQPNQ